MKTLEFTRVWSFFAPTYQYRVTDLLDQGRTIGYVARLEGSRVWHASNKTWTAGGDLVATFRTRDDAARALRFIADDARNLEVYGGYAAGAADQAILS